MTKEDVTYIDKLNELRLEIYHPNNDGIVFVLVEGETDVRLYRKLIDSQTCNVDCVPGGNPKLEECVGELIKIYPLVIGVRDADFLHLDSSQYVVPNMFLTDEHDMEMILIKDDEVWQSIMSEYGPKNNSEIGLTRNKIMLLLEVISLLKWLNWRESLALTFRGVGFSGCLDVKNWAIDFPQFFDRTVAKSPDTPIKFLTDVQGKLDALRDLGPSPFQLVNGHDFLKVLAEYFKITGGTTAINDELIASALRIAYRPNLFTGTMLYAQILDWQMRHGVTILAA